MSCFICEWVKKAIAWLKGEDEYVYYNPSSPESIEPTPVYEEDGRLKRALLVGINVYEGDGNDLSGCVNDVDAMRSLLINSFGFHPDNIRVVTDERATREEILLRLKWLVSNVSSGSELVFHYSGHGSQVRDRWDGDELDDYLDEILCPTDMDWDNPLRDDDLYTILRGLPPGVFLSCIIDACHSGTMTRDGKNKDRKMKFMPPPYDISTRVMDRELGTRAFAKSFQKDVQNHVLLSGCKDNQYSSDAYIEGRWRGAMTWAFIKAIESNPSDANWVTIHRAITETLKDEEYEQEPQLSGAGDLIGRSIFGGK